MGGFPAARDRLTAAWARHRVSNPVVVTGDWHSTFVHDILRDFDRPESAVVATEFVGTSISGNGDGEVHGPYCGYMRCRVDAAQMRVDMRTVTTVSRPDAPETTFASFVVHNGHPGALPG